MFKRIKYNIIHKLSSQGSQVYLNRACMKCVAKMGIDNLKIFNEDLFWRFFHWIFEIFLRRFIHGDFSFGIWFWRFFLLMICSWRFFLEHLFWKLNFWKNFNEDLFMEIFPWRFILRDFSIQVLEIFIEDFFIGDFSFGIWFWRFFLWKIENFPFENGDFFLWSQSEEDEDGLEMMKIYSWGKNDDD